MFRLSNTNRFFKNFHRIVPKNTSDGKNVVEKIEAKVKGTFAENWVKYWKNVFIDYGDVAVDLGKSMKEKPFKSVCMLWGLSGLVVCARCNPNEAHFRDEYLRCINKLILVHPTAQNNESYEYLKHIETCYSKELVRTLNFGFGTIIWVHDNSTSCKAYSSTCPYFPIQYGTFKNRIIDVGFLNRWWILSNKMSNYDVNF